MQKQAYSGRSYSLPAGADSGGAGLLILHKYDIQEITITIPAGSTLESLCSEDYFYWGVCFSPVRNFITVSSVRLIKK